MLAFVDKRFLQTIIIITMIIFFMVIIFFDLSNRLDNLEKENKINRDLIKIYNKPINSKEKLDY